MSAFGTQSGHPFALSRCPLLGVKRHALADIAEPAFDYFRPAPLGGLNTRELDYLRPLLNLVGDKFAKFSGRPHHRLNS
jgi:hypothetical protein